MNAIKWIINSIVYCLTLSFVKVFEEESSKRLEGEVYQITVTTDFDLLFSLNIPFKKALQHDYKLLFGKNNKYLIDDKSALEAVSELTWMSPQSVQQQNKILNGNLKTPLLEFNFVLYTNRAVDKTEVIPKLKVLRIDNVIEHTERVNTFIVQENRKVFINKQILSKIEEGKFPPKCICCENRINLDSFGNCVDCNFLPCDWVDYEPEHDRITTEIDTKDWADILEKCVWDAKRKYPLEGEDD